MTSKGEGSPVCARCGACLPACPVYRNTLLERLGPRGKHALVHDHKVDFSLESVRETVSACLQCGACEATCSAGIAVNREILNARAQHSEFAPSWPALWKLFGSDAGWSALSGLLSSLPASSGILYRLASMAVSGSSTGKKIFPVPASVPLLSRRGLEKFYQRPEAPVSHGRTFPLSGKRVALFSGCVQNFIYPEIIEAMAWWFPGTEFVVPAAQCCCGLPALSAGAVDPARRLIERNLRVFQETGCDIILTGCASCRYMIDRWPETVGPDFKEMAEQAAAVTAEFTELLYNEDFLPAPELSVNSGVAFHAPCHSRFSSCGTGAAEAFLQRMLGNDFVQIEQGCCGHGGSFSMKHAEISHGIFRERVHALKESGASTVVTTCSGCLLQWRSMAAQHGLEGIKVLHAAEIMQAGPCRYALN